MLSRGREAQGYGERNLIMLFLACCCFCYGVVATMWLLKRGLTKGDSIGCSGENQDSELDAVGVPVHDPVSKTVVDDMKFFKKGRDKGQGWCPPTNLSFKTLWIERKSFRASIIIPGRHIRVTELLPDRFFSADFNPSELSWVIVALREASSNNSGKFSKLSSMGRRSMAVNLVTNRAGEFFQLSCSVEGRNSRLLCIPAGKNRAGWGMLANYLAAVVNGGKIWVKKTSHSVPSSARSAPFHHREHTETRHAFSIDSDRGNLPCQVDSGWTGGLLPELLKSGLQLSLGAPFSPGEDGRSFLWKTHLSEMGLGIMVVENVQRGSLGLKIADEQIGRGSVASLVGVVDVDLSGDRVGDGVAVEVDSGHGVEAEDFSELVGERFADVVVSGHGAEEEALSAFLSDASVDSTLGNLIPKVQNLLAGDDALSVCDLDPSVGGPFAAGFVQFCYVNACAQLSLSEHAGTNPVRAEDPIDCVSAQLVAADESVFPSLGELMGLGEEFMGSGFERADEVMSCRISGGRVSALEAKSYQFGSNGMGSFLGNAHVRTVGSHDSRFLARIEDITILDIDESISFDSPVSDHSASVAVEMSREVGVCCLDDSCVICGSLEACGGSGDSVRW